MKKQTIALVAVLLAIVLCGWFFLTPQTVQAANVEWLTDVEKAKKIAVEENKDLLINFTGSDWCTFCIMLRKEVFDQEGFQVALDDYVPVIMDFPRDPTLISEETKKQNEEWNRQLGIEGFPTVVLTDASGRPYGSLGYVTGGPPAFLTQLKSERLNRQVRDEKFAAAEKAEGVEKAKLLAEGLEKIPSKFYLPTYQKEVETIISLDVENQAGLKAKYTRVVQEAEADEFIAKIQVEVETAYNEDGEDAALKLIREAQAGKDAAENPILQVYLAKAEVQVLRGFDRGEEALARLEEHMKAESFTDEDRQDFRETKARILTKAGDFEKAIETYETLMTNATKEKEKLSYLSEKAKLLAKIGETEKALSIFEDILKEWKKEERGWLTLQVNRAEALKDLSRFEESGKVYDEMLTSDDLRPVQKVMLLIEAAGAYKKAGNTDLKTERAIRAEKLLDVITEADDIPPQTLIRLAGDLDDVQSDDSESE